LGGLDEKQRYESNETLKKNFVAPLKKKLGKSNYQKKRCRRKTGKPQSGPYTSPRGNGTADAQEENDYDGGGNYGGVQRKNYSLRYSLPEGV